MEKNYHERLGMLNNAHELYDQAKKCEGFDVVDFGNSMQCFHLSQNPKKDYKAKERILDIARMKALEKLVNYINSDEEKTEEDLEDYAIQAIAISGNLNEYRTLNEEKREVKGGFN